MRPVFGGRRRGRSAAFRTDLASVAAASTLGYDPRPDVAIVDGNWQPPVYFPLPATRWRIETASSVWWRGPPWALLRNASFFLWRTWDHGAPGDLERALDDIPATDWRRAIEDAVPGEVSRGALSLWARHFGVIGAGDHVAWPDEAHLHDQRPCTGMALVECVLALEDAGPTETESPLPLERRGGRGSRSRTGHNDDSQSPASSIDRTPGKFSSVTITASAACGKAS